MIIMDTFEYVDKEIFEAYKPLIEKYDITRDKLADFYKDFSWIGMRDDTDLLIFYLVDKCRFQMIEAWPLQESALTPYFSSLGYALNS